MSIVVRSDRCVGCGLCAEICPGGLIRMRSGKAEIPRPERCWGCTACLKECPVCAIALFLGEDMGGLGGQLTVRREDTRLYWTVTAADGSVRQVTTDSRDANRY